MSRILGLDLGTNSIGWAIRDTEIDGNQIIDKGGRIFSEGVKRENGNESSRAAERTNYRNARKIKYRRKLRKYETLKVLSLNGMCPLSVEEVEEWKKSGFRSYPLNPEFLKWLRTDDDENVNPYYFRAKASKEKVTLLEAGRAFYHIAQRRGFLSNRLDQSAEGIFEEHNPKLGELIDDAKSISEILSEFKEYFTGIGILDESIKGGFAKDMDEGDRKLKTLYNSLIGIIKKNGDDFEKCREDLILRLNRKEDQGKVKQGISEISQAMSEGGFTTLGQYFLSLYSKDKIRNQYTAREEHYVKEFEMICKIQSLGIINENEILPEKRYTGLAKDIYKAIFFQRPLKSQKQSIGKCVFEKNKSRCAISHPDFEEYRMWAFLNNIKFGTQNDKALRFLTQKEKEQLIPKFLRKRESFKFEDLAKGLIEKGATFGFYKSSKRLQYHYLFNYRPTDTVAGSPVSASMKNIFGDDWKQQSFEYKSSDGIAENKTVDYRDLWHLLYVATSEAYLYEYAKDKLGLPGKEAKAFSKIKIKKDFAKLSLNAISKILPYLKQGLLYSHAVFMANIEKIIDKDIWENEEQRELVKKKIGEIIDNNSYENSKYEIINGLIKEAKNEGYFYSEEAERSYKESLLKRLKAFCKPDGEEDLPALFDELYPVFIKQLNDRQFIKIERLDEKVKSFLLGHNTDGLIYCSDQGKTKKLYHPSDIDVFKKKVVKDDLGNEKVVLGSPITSSIKNPMAMRTLHQLRKVLNTLITEGLIDEKTIVHIEMARELNDANKRKGIQDYQNENENKRKTAIKEIKKLYFDECGKEVEPTEDDLLRYQLWVEQDKKEIYEPSVNQGLSRQISICQIIGSNPDYDIEHTIPRSISQDNSQMNKTLCSKVFNRDIKKNKIPAGLTNHEAVLPYIEHWKEEADNLSREIETITRSIKAVATKEAKDKKIRKRHYLTLKRDYLQGKYERFIWEEPKVGFKNSQIPDTGIITKYAQAYLKSYFRRVESVKGGLVAEFRKQWGLQGSFIDDFGQKHYKEKDRSRHTHHTIDAITIACMTKDKYDVLAAAWALEDEQNKKQARAIIEEAKPWKTFNEDIAKIEVEILISHHTPDTIKKQSKKIIRVRGIKQYTAETEKDERGRTILKKDTEGKIIYKLDREGKKIPRFQKGDTIRGSLHLDTIYGRIKDPISKEERCVIRKDLESIKTTDVENIVDAKVKEIVKKAIEKGILVVASNPQQKNNLKDKVWINEEKGIPINKVRIYANSVKNPLAIRNHRPLSQSRHEYKRIMYGMNDENYAIAIYEGIDKKGKIKRDFETINNKDAGEYYKLSNNEFKRDYDIVTNPHDKTNLPLKYILNKGQMILFYKESPSEILDLNVEDLHKRLYKLAKFDAQGRLTFRPHFEARPAGELKEVYNVDTEKPSEQIRLQISKLNMMVEGYEFSLTPSGKITFK